MSWEVLSLIETILWTDRNKCLPNNMFRTKLDINSIKLIILRPKINIRGLAFLVIIKDNESRFTVNCIVHIYKLTTWLFYFLKSKYYHLAIIICSTCILIYIYTYYLEYGAQYNYFNIICQSI